MLIGTIDVNHLAPISLTLTWDEGHKVSAEQNLFALFFRTPSSQDEMRHDVEAIQTEHPHNIVVWDLADQGKQLFLMTASESNNQKTKQLWCWHAFRRINQFGSNLVLW